MSMMSIFNVSGSAASAQSQRLNVVASNLANARTTHGANGQPYRRLDPIFHARAVATGSFDPVLKSVREVELAGVRPDASPGEQVYDPGHPDANPAGYVTYPNVNVVTEMVNLMTASRAYEAGVTSIESLKAMARSALKIGQ